LDLELEPPDWKATAESLACGAEEDEKRMGEAPDEATTHQGRGRAREARTLARGKHCLPVGLEKEPEE